MVDGAGRAALPAGRQRERLDALRHAVLSGRGVTTPEERATAARPRGAERAATTALDRYLAKVRDTSYAVTDADVAAVRDEGQDEEAVFELTVAAALGAASDRLDAALAAMQAPGPRRGAG